MRGTAYLAATLSYAGVWLALAIGLLGGHPVPSDFGARGAIRLAGHDGVLGMIAPLIAGAAAPIDPLDPMTVVTQFETQQAIARLSPEKLYGEIAALLLNPAARSVGPCSSIRSKALSPGAPLPTLQSLLIVWPQLSGLVAAMILSLLLHMSSFSVRRSGHDGPVLGAAAAAPTRSSSWQRVIGLASAIAEHLAHRRTRKCIKCRPDRPP